MQIDPTIIFSFLQNFTLDLFAKGFLLIFLLLYVAFSFILLTQVQSLNKVIMIVNAHASGIIFFLAFLQLIFAISLFGAVLVIL